MCWTVDGNCILKKIANDIKKWLFCRDREKAPLSFKWLPTFPMKSKNFQINQFNLDVSCLSRVILPHWVSHLFHFAGFSVTLRWYHFTFYAIVYFGFSWLTACLPARLNAVCVYFYCLLFLFNFLTFGLHIWVFMRVYVCWNLVAHKLFIRYVA